MRYLNKSVFPCLAVYMRIWNTAKVMWLFPHFIFHLILKMKKKEKILSYPHLLNPLQSGRETFRESGHEAPREIKSLKREQVTPKWLEELKCWQRRRCRCTSIRFWIVFLGQVCKTCKEFVARAYHWIKRAFIYRRDWVVTHILFLKNYGQIRLDCGVNDVWDLHPLSFNYEWDEEERSSHCS